MCEGGAAHECDGVPGQYKSTETCQERASFCPGWVVQEQRNARSERTPRAQFDPTAIVYMTMPANAMLHAPVPAAMPYTAVPANAMLHALVPANANANAVPYMPVPVATPCMPVPATATPYMAVAATATPYMAVAANAPRTDGPWRPPLARPRVGSRFVFLFSTNLGALGADGVRRIGRRVQDAGGPRSST